MEQTLLDIKEAMVKIQELQEKKENITIDDLDVDREEIFSQMLDDCYEKVIVCGLEFYPSDVLKSCDPVAFRCYTNDYMSEIDIESLSEYTNKIEEIDQEIEDLKTDIKDIIDNL